ncbi:MAG: class I SAM-dependent methyltransferase, partial [Ignavibacteria bacterium]|nr:class I SAM-dependent methyltransferase [Ignavibacteria bacterium]
MQSRTKSWQKYYDTCAELDDKIFQTARFDVPKFQYQEIIKDIRKKLKLNTENLLLDIGCANGLIDRSISRDVKKIIGFDISTKELTHAIKNNHSISNILFCAGDAFKLPIRINSVDKTLLYGVTMHFEAEDIKKIIAEIIDVTRNRGLIFIGDNIREYENYKGKKRNKWNNFKAYCQLNPENKSFIWIRVLMFLVVKKMVLTLRRILYKLQNKARTVPDPFPNISYSEEYMLEMIRELGQEGRIYQQNYKLPYALDRYDILIDVKKNHS